MPVNPTVGRAGGQKYDVAKAIRTFLEQMAGGAGFSFGAAVIKELIQNADDAGATELIVALDERNGDGLPTECRDAYGPLLEPAVLVGNDAAFRVAGEVPIGDQDDFTAICEVAGGHKRFNPTAAGRFGIGFNSVYFLTDTPVLFSRREVHLFDLRHLMLDDDGWRFSLDEFPASASNAGPIKTVLEWTLPKAILGDFAFQEIATTGRDYRRTVFRLPLRRTVASGSAEERGPVFQGSSFPTDVDRRELLRQMCEEAKRSLLFLKSLRRVAFGGLAERRFVEWVVIEATRRPPAELERFVADVRAMRAETAKGARRECSFRTDVSVRVTAELLDVSPGSASHQVTHVADFTNPDLVALANRLRQNDERAVPWVSFATPLDAASFDWEGSGDARWRVFLPLAELGPSACIVNAAVFVDPSRRAIEFRTHGSDETQRKSLWNRTLVEQLLSPLLRDASISIIDTAPKLVEQDPKKYLSLFPVAKSSEEPATCLADVVRASFGSDLWLLKLYDLWKEPFDLLLGRGGSQVQLERVPERLARYKDAFRSLSTDSRRFIAWNLADALSERLVEGEGVEVTKIGQDVADHVLKSDRAPDARDLEYVLRSLGEVVLDGSQLQDRWAFQREGHNGRLLRFDSQTLYLVRTQQTPPVYDAIAAIGISPVTAEWVAADIGLRALPASRTESLTNVLEADARGALELLRRVGDNNRHDLLGNANAILPIVEFLCSQSAPLLTTDLRLAFLVKTASGKRERRRLGVVFLRPEQPTSDETDLWQGLLRGSFAEVDPQFTPPLRRLLEHAPQLLESIGDEDCRVQVASGEMLDVLHAARVRDDDFVHRIANQVREGISQEGERRFQVYRAARLVLREAEKRWELLDQAVRDTVLLMPLHRGADGAMVSLQAVGEEASTIPDRFFLQSEDDLRDAPIEPRAGQLLHSLDPELRRFYRRRLGIKERNRLEVLKECLRQIGADAENSGGILKYIDKYYREAVEQLREGGEDTADDLRELKELHSAARGVPCLDGVWRRAADCLDARHWRALLETQGWAGQQLDDLLVHLCFPQHVATASSNEAASARTLWQVQEVDQSSVVTAALTSESSELPFAHRVRVVAANLKLLPALPVTRAAVTNTERLSGLGGPTDLASLALVDPVDVSLGPDILRAIVPEAADLAALARTFTGNRVQVLVAILRAFGVPSVDATVIESRVIASFADVWSRLATGSRLELLEWLGRREAVVPAHCIGLDTVLVQGPPERWLAPTNVIAPAWASGSPPNVSAANLARTADVPSHVQRLWSQWCGLRTLETVVSFVVAKTAELPAAQWAAGANRLARWLEDVSAFNKVDALAATLQRLPWVLARKGDSFAFKHSHEVIAHPGAEVLRHEFWVVAGRIPASLAGSVETNHLQGSRTVLESVGRALSSSASATPTAARAVYELLTELTTDETAARTWREIAKSAPVYRLFRATGRDADRLVADEELFLGDKDGGADFGDVLVCFGVDDARRGTRSLYSKLGVRLRPSPAQLVGALARIPSDFREHGVYAALVDALTQFGTENAAALDVSSVKVRSCAKSYQPLGRCYRDADLDRPSRVSPECRDRLIDLREPANKKLTRWLDDACPGGVIELRSVAAPELTREPEALDGVTSNVLDAWRDWLAELATPGSVVQEAVHEIGFVGLLDLIRLDIVGDIRVRFRLEDGTLITPSDEWRGLDIFHDSRDRIFLRRELVDRDFLGQVDDVERLDARIADTLADLLRARAASEKMPPPSGALLSVVRDTLERPATVLRRMKDEKEEHFFHQYVDQAADPEFAQLFDIYRRTSTSATDKRLAMKTQMWNLIALRFVEARRTQIRGYGYDEFAIFAELVQNAEDAYSQRSQLGLPAPPQHGVTFTYSAAAHDRTLSVRHYGRPFNMWRQGSKRIDAFRYDVEGVLKSAGSFKPHSRLDGARPIGRFGLGFKSVYLITDRPRIHSGDWHFEIAAGAIPNEVAVPALYEREETRIVLPLTPGAEEDWDRERERFANLLPFLRKVDHLRIDHPDGSTLNLRTTSQEVLRTTDGHIAERVRIRAADDSSEESSIALLRVRHGGHDGQLGLLLGSDGLPVAWNDAFEFDVFAALPLRVHLDCGVGVSNLFEVQSGRTHLIDPSANAPKVAEVARALPALVKSLVAGDGPGAAAVMSRFWFIWRWDRGDEEARPLRIEMAKALAALARSIAVVPTLDPAYCVKLSDSTVFMFDNIPEDFANELIAGAVEFPVGAIRVKLHARNVVPEGAIAAIARTFAAAQDKTPIGVSRIGWSELGEVFAAKPWLADRPALVSAMARSLPPARIDQVRPWLSKCLFRAANGANLSLGDLLPPRFPGIQLLPSRLLVLLDDSYDEQATSLLKQVGLPSRPPLEAMKKWISAGLDQDECAKLLQYLSEAGRWRRDYYELGQVLRSVWFCGSGRRLTTAEALSQQLITLEDLDAEPAFRAWLGIDSGPIQIIVEQDRWDRPVADPQRALAAIWDWWSDEGDGFVRRYEERTYPDAEPPRLTADFLPQDTIHRQRWLSLMILASLQTMGRTNPEQHRNFLRQCIRQGWLDVFADPRLPADDWIGILDRYLGSQTYDIPFYHWVRQFVSIYQLSRWLPEYVWSFLDIERATKRFDLDRVTRPAHSSELSGGGHTAPPLTRALGIGACFVVRELVRAGVLRNQLSYDHAYVAVGRVRYVFGRLGMVDLRHQSASYQHSRQIHDFLLSHLGPTKADFDRCFDLPFLAIADDPGLQERFLECRLPSDDESPT